MVFSRPLRSTRRQCGIALMRRLTNVVALGAFALTLLIYCPAAIAEKRVVLVVGNGAYQHAAPLPNPTRDAKAIAQMFQMAGFDIVLLRNDVGNLEFKRALRDFFVVAKGADIAVVFFAGHGIQIADQNYLIPVDAKLAQDYDVTDEAISLERIIEAIEPAARLRLVVLDACRDNPFIARMQRRGATRQIVSRGLSKVEPILNNTLIAYAAKAGSTAEDGPGDNSPFTMALIKHVAEPGLDIRLALGRVRDEVLRNTHNDQEPFVYGSLGGGSVSLVPPVVVAKPAAPAEVRADYELVERINTRKAWELFINQYKTGMYVDLARERLRMLEREEVSASSARMQEENSAWDRVRDSEDPAAIRRFIDRNKSSPHAIAAQSLLDSLEKVAREKEEMAAAEEAKKHAEAKRLAEEQAAAEAKKLAEEKAAAEAERSRKAEEARKQAEAKKLAEEQAAAEAKKLVEEKAAAEAERLRKAEEARKQAEAKKLAEEQAAAEAKKLAEEKAAAEAERLRKAEEARRQAEAKRLAEEQAAAEAKKFAEEKAAAEAERLRKAEEARKQAEAKRLAEEQAAAAAKKLAEEKAAVEAERLRKADEARKQAEAKRLAEEQAAAAAKKLAEEKAAVDAERLRKADEARKRAEAQRLAEANRAAAEAEHIRRGEEARKQVEVKRLTEENSAAAKPGVALSIPPAETRSSRNEQMAYMAPLPTVDRDGRAFQDCADCPVVVRIPAGSFTMGQTKGDASAAPQHTVTVRAFAMGQYPVTVGEWRACVASGGCNFTPRMANANDRTPVHNTSWDDAQQYILWLSRSTGENYRLPTEAEWEYAARAHTSTRYWWGDNVGTMLANCSDCGGSQDARTPLPVGSFKPNPFGLHDILGGVAQWVADCWFPNYQGAPADARAREQKNCQKRVLRGGSFRTDRESITASARSSYDSSVRYIAHGFRVARDLN
jgi:formylglycine-generating enzyme required for sulfatase activity